MTCPTSGPPPAGVRAQFCVEVFNEVARMTLTKDLDPIRNEKICEEVFVTALRDLIQEKRNIKLVDFIKAITSGRQQNSEDGAENISYDQDDVEAFEQDQLYLHRSNFRQKLMNPRTPILHKAHLLFLWRSMLQFCCCHYQQGQADAQLSDCRFKLVPTMTEFAEFVGDFFRTGLGGSETMNVLATPSRPAFPEHMRASPARTRSARKRRVEKEQHELKEAQLIHYGMRQIFRIFPLLEMDDVGKSHWRELAFSVLANPTVALNKQFLQELIDSIMTYHYPRDDQAELALREFCDAINNIVTRGDNDQDPLLPNGGANRSPSVSSSSSKGSSQLNASYHMSKLDDATRIRCLAIFTTLLRSGRFMRIGGCTELTGLYEVLITKASLSSTSAKERSMAYQCLTWRCLLTEEDAATFTPIIWHALELHSGPPLLPYLDMIGDLVRFYGYARVSKWCREGEEEVVEDSFMQEEEEERAVAEGRATQGSQGTTTTTTSGGGEGDNREDAEDDERARERENRRRRVLDLYIRGEEDPVVALRTTEHLCGWLLSGSLNGKAKDSVQVLAHLLLSMHNTEARQSLPEVHACLCRFLPCFVCISRPNQQKLIHAFVEAFGQLKEWNLALREEARDIEELELAATVVQHTSQAMLAEQAIERDLGSVHTEFAQLLLETVREQPDELYAAIYLSLLPKLDPVDDQEMVQNLLFLCTDTMRHFGDVYEVGTAGKLQHLKTYMKMLNKRADNLQQQQQRRPSTSTSSDISVVASSTYGDGRCTPAKRALTNFPTAME